MEEPVHVIECVYVHELGICTVTVKLLSIDLSVPLVLWSSDLLAFWSFGSPGPWMTIELENQPLYFVDEANHLLAYDALLLCNSALQPPALFVFDCDVPRCHASALSRCPIHTL